MVKLEEYEPLVDSNIPLKASKDADWVGPIHDEKPRNKGTRIFSDALSHTQGGVEGGTGVEEGAISKCQLLVLHRHSHLSEGQETQSDLCVRLSQGNK